ncbi:MAG: protein translocase subunit SecF [Thermoanaerobaculia bacterium]|nr:protein translocase subunit SecF [Thermoanaerobaculia bacterium]
MDILRDPKFDFMKYRRFWIGLSFATILAGIVAIFFLDRLNFGVDFAGGTQMTLKFREQPNVEELRGLVAEAGYSDAVIQRFGVVGANEVMIRTPIVGGSEEGSAARLLAALNARYNPGGGRVDLNQIGAISLAEVLTQANPDGIAATAAAAHYQAVAEAVMAERKVSGIFTDWDALSRAAGISARALETLRGTATLGSFAVLGTENVGPQVGAELRQRGVLAVVGAMIGMMLYIWMRFELRFAVGSTMAVLHDVLITLGFFAWAGHEFNLTTVAAFLTLIGYSVNDTVVTFDRVRENLRKNRTADTVEMLNRSINQTLSRTILTGGTTLAAALSLYFLGGDVLRGFAFVMAVGIVVGTYSSIFIASPFALLWEQWFGRGRRERARSGG